MITERQLEIMEKGASPEVETLCAEVRRLRAGIQSVIDSYKKHNFYPPGELLELVPQDG